MPGPHTAGASFRLVLSLQRCRMRSALGRGGTAGCGLGLSACGCSSAGRQRSRMRGPSSYQPGGPAPPHPQARAALTQPAPRALRLWPPVAAALLQKADAVAPIGVLAEALPGSLVDAVRVADGRPAPAERGGALVTTLMSLPTGTPWPPLGSNDWPEGVAGKGRHSLNVAALHERGPLP